EERSKDERTYELKLKGFPWRAMGTEVNTAQLVALALLAAMEEKGFEVVGSLDIRTGVGDEHEGCDTCFLASKA
ncbi:hypothetical protein JCM8097_004460, partial [Rhodosporidiobolus ruineniae]